MIKLQPITLSAKDRKAAIAAIADNGTPSITFYILLVLSTVIAAYGLLANSTAVVIGAMLVAPLMGPIFGITLGLVRGNRALFINSALAELTGVALAVLLSTLVGLVPLRPEFGSEILARVQPNLFDLIIALVSGLVGAYATVNPKLNQTIAGVAIATALVPPLAVCGLCLAAGQLSNAWGAFLLFTANFLAIQFVATIVFILAGIGFVETTSQNRWRWLLRTFGPALVALIMLAVVFTRTLAVVVEEQRLNRNVGAALEEQLRGTLGAQLASYELRRDGAKLAITASVLTPRAFTPEQVAGFEAGLRERCGYDVELIVRSVNSRDVDHTGIVFLSEEERSGLSEQAQAAGRLERTQRLLEAELAAIPGARLEDLSLSDGAEPEQVFAIVETPTPVTPDQVARIETRLKQILSERATLVVRSVLTRDADSQRYIYDPEPQRAPPEQLQLLQTLERLVREQLGTLAPGTSLIEVRTWNEPLPFERPPDWSGPPPPAPADSRLVVHAFIRTPTPVTAGQVAPLEAALKAKLQREHLRLIVRSILEADTDTSGFIAAPD